MYNRTLAVFAAAGAVGAIAAPAAAQLELLLSDRATDSLWRLVDLNNDGVIQDPAEVFLFHDGANAAGTLGIQNINTMAVRLTDRFVVGGDQVNRNLYWFQDMNTDQDANDIGESLVAADAGNLSGVSFAFPTGAAFDSAGRLLVVNAGNGFGADGIYRLDDLNNDGDWMDAGEVTNWVLNGGFGGGNGPFSPQEMVIDAAGVGYLRNSSANLHGIYRFEDINNNGAADDAGEFTVFFDATNASGIVPSAGFALEFDATRPGAIYTLQIASGGLDQLIRVQDLNNDGDAQDAGEAAIVWSEAASGFSAIDVVSLDTGEVFITDNSGKKILLLRDVNNDGDFDDAGEVSDWFVSTSNTVGDVRQLAVYRLPVATCPADWDGSGGIDGDDITAFFIDWQAGTADIDGSGGVDGDDITVFFDHWQAGC